MAVYETPIMEFRAGRAVSRTFSVFFRNFLPFALIALVLTSPTYIYTILTLPVDWTEAVDMPMMGVGQIVVWIVAILLYFLVTAALVYGTLQDLRGEKASIGECFSQGLGRMFPVLGIALVTYLAIFLATLVLVIPGIYVAVMLWVTIPVAVVERRGIGSLGRSADLTRGYRWRIVGALLIYLLIAIGISMLFGIVSAGLMFGTMGADMFSSDVESTEQILSGMGPTMVAILAIDWVSSALISMFGAILVAVSYHDMRVAKEGVDTDQIAAVFD